MTDDTDLTDPHGENERLRRENERLRAEIADLDFLRHEGGSDSVAAMEAMLRGAVLPILRAENEALRSGAVCAAVKPLEWSVDENDDDLRIAHSVLGLYFIRFDPRANEETAWMLFISGKWVCFAAEDAAKTAAQADYEARILSAITLRHEIEVRSEGMREALEARAGGLVTDSGEAWKYIYSHKDGTGGEYDLLSRREPVGPSQPTIGGAELDALVRKLRTEWPVGPANRVACQIMGEAADAITALRAQPDWKAMAEPDYCYNPEDWEYTQPWDARHELAESVLDYGRDNEPARVSTLISGPDKWVTRLPLDTDGDGEADDWEYRWFDSEEAARAALSDLAKMKGE